MKKRTPYLYTFFITLLLGVTQVVYAQEVHPDVQKLNDSTWAYIYKDPQTAKNWGEKAIQKAKKVNDQYSLGAAKTRYAIAYDLSGDFEKALEIYLESLSVLDNFKPSEELGFLYNNLSLCYYNFYDYDRALVYVKQAYQNDKALRDSSGMASALTNMGLFYGYLNLSDSSLWAYEKSIALAKQIGDTINYQSATSNKAKILFQKGKYREALQIYRELSPIVQSDVAKISWYISISQTYNKLNQGQVALAHADSALRLATQNSIKERILYALENYAGIAAQNGQTQEALENYRSYIALKDSLFKSEMDERVANQEAQFEILEKEKEASEAQKIALEEKLQKEAFYQTLIWVSVGFIVLVILTIFLIIYTRSQRKANRLAKEKIEQKELFMHEIHHRVKNNLQMVSAMIDIELAATENNSQPFLYQLKDRLTTMAKTHQFLYERHDFQGIQLHAYFEELKGLFQESSPKNITFDFNIQPLIIHVDSVIPISLIISEWITNSIKYAFHSDENGKISISIQRKGEILLLEYADNGKGMQETQEGFGSSMVRSLARQLKAKISVDSSQGTQHKMEIQRYKQIEED